MSTFPLAMFIQFAAACPAAGVPMARMVSTAHVESGLNATSIHDNATGRAYTAETGVDAAALARLLLSQGHRIDAGIMQITDANWVRLGLTADTVFDPRTNICAGKAVLAEAYALERRVSCRYNTGRPDCSNGYPERIEQVLARVQSGDPSIPASPPAAASPAAPPPPGPLGILVHRSGPGVQRALVDGTPHLVNTKGN